MNKKTQAATTKGMRRIARLKKTRAKARTKESSERVADVLERIEKRFDDFVATLESHAQGLLETSVVDAVKNAIVLPSTPAMRAVLEELAAPTTVASGHLTEDVQIAIRHALKLSAR